MHTTRMLTGIVWIAGAASGVAQGQPALGQDVVLVSAVSGTERRVHDERGRFTALHLLRAGDAPERDEHVREYLSRAPERAGVEHVFVVEGNAQEAAAWAQRLGHGAGAVHVDRDGTVRRALGLHDETEGTVPNAGHVRGLFVLDAQGRELFRMVPGERAPDLGFDSFSRRLDAAWQAPALAQYNVPPAGTGVEGYDLVAYFTSGNARRGRASLSSRYRGVEYRFESEEHRRLFAADPERYLPTYGGWCASAMGAKGTKVGIDPTNFKVKDGRLFLFYKGTFADALKDWNRHEKEWEPAADANWKRLTGETPRIPAR